MANSYGPGLRGFKDKSCRLLVPHSLSMYNSRYNISNYTKMFALPNDVVLCGANEHLHNYLPLLP